MVEPSPKRLRVDGEGPTAKQTASSENKLATGAKRSNPYMPMFEGFRADLDAHHDRRERIIKASRDVTANSKKMCDILAAKVVGHSTMEIRAPVLIDRCDDRVRAYGSPLPESTLKDIKPYEETCRSLLTSLIPELPGMNAWRYRRQVAPGLEEMMEAQIFSHYLQHQRLLDIEQARTLVPEGIFLTEEEWLGGVMDSIGECMRWAITGMATHGEIPSQSADGSNSRNIAQDLRELRAELQALCPQGSGLERDLNKKMDVMKTCVDKVELAAYSLAVRGKERPKGWVPEAKVEAVPQFEDS